jgi:hypothetical protein
VDRLSQLFRCRRASEVEHRAEEGEFLIPRQLALTWLDEEGMVCITIADAAAGGPELRPPCPQAVDCLTLRWSVSVRSVLAPLLGADMVSLLVTFMGAGGLRVTDEAGTDHAVRQAWTTSWLVAGALAGVVGLLANLAQLDGVFAGGWLAILRLVLLFVAFGAVAHIVSRRPRRDVPTVALAMVCVSAIAVFCWLPIPSAPAAGDEADASSVGPDITATTTSRPPARLLEHWAADINDVCAAEASRTGDAFARMRTAGVTITQLSQQYGIDTPLDVVQHAVELDPPMRQATEAAAIVDSSYTAVWRRMKSVDWPSAPEEKATAESWADQYEQLADTFTTLYETLVNYTATDSDVVRGTYFTKFALLDGPAYNEMTTDVLDAGRDIGVESCL